jgi:prophage regulatory protein
MHMILRLPEVKRSTGLSRSTIYLRVAEGTFPKPVCLGGRAVGWLAEEVQDWLQNRIDASRKSHSNRITAQGQPAYSDKAPVG